LIARNHLLEKTDVMAAGVAVDKL